MTVNATVTPVAVIAVTVFGGGALQAVSAEPAQPLKNTIKKTGKLTGAVAHSQRPATVPGWKLAQFSYFAGRHQVSLCKQGLRIENLSTGFVLIGKAPLWKLNCISSAKKAYCAIDIDHLNHELTRTNAMFGGTVYVDIPLMPAKIATRRRTDVPTTTYQSSAEFDAQQMKLIEAKEISPNSAIELKYDTWKADLPAIEGLVLSRLYGTPSAGGIPIGMNAKNQNHHGHLELSTDYVERTNLPLDLFEVPEGYSKVRSIDELKNRQVDMFGGDDVKTKAGSNSTPPG